MFTYIAVTYTELFNNMQNFFIFILFLEAKNSLFGIIEIKHVFVLSLFYGNRKGIIHRTKDKYMMIHDNNIETLS